MKHKIKKASYHIFHKLLAKLLRRFWTHCPRCHGYFAGYHDFAHHKTFIDSGNSINYRIICHKCHNEHKQLTNKLT